LTDSNGNVTDRIQYSAYGMVTFRSGTNDTPFQYNGRYGVQTDPNGLLYMRNRYYNPYISRFINADPSGFAGGLNFYSFANGNPISMTDPFGLGAVGEGGGSYWHDVGQVFLGEGDAVVGLATGIVNAASHPIDTINNIGTAVNNAIDNPGQAAQGIGNSIENTFNALTGPDPRAAGQAAGNIIIAGASVAAPFAEVGAVGGAGEIAEEAGSGAGETAKTFDAIGSTGKVGEQWLADNLGGESQVYFKTSQGARYIDQLANGIANESKVGYTSLTPNVQLQIAKDVELLQTQQIQGSTWHFFTSPVTGIGGPSQPLLNALQQAGIKVVIH
jgi:RHS repeat-associated protein